MNFRDHHITEVKADFALDPSVSAQVLCENYSYAVDARVVAAAREAIAAGAGWDVDTGTRGRGAKSRRPYEGWSLMALGGYGREQMCLRSDVDLQLVVPDGAPAPKAFMGELIRGLSDIGLKVGHGVRTVSEALMLAQEEFTFATAALSCRHLFGDALLTEKIRGDVYRHLSGPGLAQLVADLKADRGRRRERLGDTIYLLEPDLKQGVGGLRDAQLVGWLSLLTGLDHDRAVIFAEDRLLRVRMALHALCAFRNDRLSFEYQEPVAALLGLRSPEALMQHVHLAMREIAGAARRLMELARRGIRRPKIKPVVGDPSHVIMDGRIARADGSAPRTSADVVEALATVARTQLPLEARLEEGFLALSRQIADDLARDRAANSLVLGLLVDPAEGASEALHALHRTGLLARIVPEYQAIIGRTQRDIYHVFTVDEHTLRVIDTLKAIFRGARAERFPVATGVARQSSPSSVLMVAAFLHDIGKGYGKGHHTLGSQKAATIAPRLGLDADETRLCRLLISHQADMALICMRRDLADPRPLRALARRVGDAETLDMLYLLTVADWSSVGPGAFGGWHQSLLNTLYRRVYRLLTDDDQPFRDAEGVASARRGTLILSELGEVPDAPTPETDRVDDFCGALPTRYFRAVSDTRIQAHYQAWTRWRKAAGQTPFIIELSPLPNTDQTELAIVCSDRPGLLARLTAGIARAGLNVQSAGIYGLGESVALDLFRVADPHGRLSTGPSSASLQQHLADTLALSLSEDEPRGPGPNTGRWDRPQGLPSVAPEVVALNEAASRHTVVDVRAGDRPGLLFDIARFFLAANVSVALAFVTTQGHHAVNSFYVAGPDGEKLPALQAHTLATELRLTLERRACQDQT